MRMVNVIKGDIVFQWKYGFYAIYFLMSIIYLVIFSFFTGDMKDTVISICVYSDPAAMGMFFMGALILLEKSQRVTNSIAISPVTVEEYILGKILSIAIISVIVGSILMGQGNSENYFLSSIGVFAGSIIFSLCGIIVGAKIESLNQYIVWTTPFEIVGFALVCIPFFSLVTIGLGKIIIMVVTTLLNGIVSTLIVVSISSNKVEGMAIGKISGLFGMLFFVPLIVTGTIRYVFCLFPMFWIGEWSVYGGGEKLIIAFFEFVIWICIMLWRFYTKMK